MKSENKRNWMIWAIVVLAVLNVSTFITIWYHKHQPAATGIFPSKEQRRLETDAEKFSGRYFRDKLNLDAAQMDKFREFNPVFRQKAGNITAQLIDKRKQMLMLMASDNSDTNRLNALSDSIGNLHSNLKKITYKYYLDIKAICSREQQKQLEQLFKEMFTNDIPMSYPGKGGPGWQSRKKINKN